MHKKGSVSIAMGLLLLAAALLLTLYNLWDARRADIAAQEAVRELKTLISTPTEPAAEPTEGEDPAPETEPATQQTESETQPAPLSAPAAIPESREMPTLELNGYRYIGYLDVASLELSLPVMEQWDYDRLQISPCRFSGNLYDDDMVLCSHNYAQHFQALKYAPIGTELTFTDAEGRVFRYAVASFETLGPHDVALLVSGEWDLTLFTCNTSGQTRCVIRCDRIQ